MVGGWIVGFISGLYILSSPTCGHLVRTYSTILYYIVAALYTISCFPSQSYGGHYVPYLTEAIVEYNKQAPARPINLRGLLVQSPITHSPDDSRGSLDYWYDIYCTT